RSAVVIAAACAVLAACGSGSSRPAATPSTPVAKAIVSLSPTATESLFAIGAGKQVIAVDDQSNFPANAPKTDLSGFKPNVEAIAAKKPDLVVSADDSSGLAASLGKLNIRVLTQPAAKTL